MSHDNALHNSTDTLLYIAPVKVQLGNRPVEASSRYDSDGIFRAYGIFHDFHILDLVGFLKGLRSHVVSPQEVLRGSLAAKLFIGSEKIGRCKNGADLLYHL